MLDLTLLLIICSAPVLTVSSTAVNVDRHVVPCPLQQQVCQCRETADECEFTLRVDEVYTFVSYELNDDRTSMGTASPYYINATGSLITSFPTRMARCKLYDEKFDEVGCTVPITVDGRTYRPCIAANGQIPGPTLVVYENQFLVVNVINNLLTEAITIHWHGMHQRNTPWMDGADQITQCPIGPSKSFQYYFRADPPGTFWYHSHQVTQRLDGFFGALIIHESAEKRQRLSNDLGLPNIIDNPETQTIHLEVWDPWKRLNNYLMLHSRVTLFPSKELNVVPVPLNEQTEGQKYFPSIPNVTPVGLLSSLSYFFSGLINGKGRNQEVPYERSRLEVFTVENGGVYRFRLIGAQNEVPYKFSIDEHNLTVIATDGSFIEPIETQFIIIHTGERYDLILRAEKPRENVNDYWIRAETMEFDFFGGFPYVSLGNVAEAILHYADGPVPQSTSYEKIKNNSIPFDVAECGRIGGCVAVNCFFPALHPSYNIRQCVNVNHLRLLWPTPESELPSATVDPNCKECETFFHIRSIPSTMNGRVMHLPSHPLQTQRGSIPSTEFCDIDKVCEGDECACVHVRNISAFNQTVRFVLASVDISHSFHLHGHHFHVLDMGFPIYNSTTQTVIGFTSRIKCTSDQNCTWNGEAPSFAIDNKTIRKDTIIVPGRGYVVIEFLSNNPGFWFLHCHIVLHSLEGMGVVINVAESRQNPAPPGFPTCDDFSLNQAQFYKSYEHEPDSSSSVQLMDFLLLIVSQVCTYIIR